MFGLQILNGGGAMSWSIAKEPTLSMLLLVTVDVLGFIPSVRKTWRNPYSETLPMWVINAIRHALNLLAISTYSALTLANPVVWVVCNVGFCVMVLVRRRTFSRNTTQ